MNNYVTLDGKRYKAVFGQWGPAQSKPARVRKLLSGNTDVTYGPAVTKYWGGTLVVPYQVTDGSYGTLADLKTTYAKLSNVTFVDHESDSCDVAFIQDLHPQPMVPILDSAESRFIVQVMLVKI